MKRAILLIVAIVLTQFAFSQYAPISTIGTVNSNHFSTQVPIKVTNFSNISDCVLKIIYDTAYVNATGVSVGPGVPGNLIAFYSTKGMIEISWLAGTSLTLPDNSTIFNLTFAKKANNTSGFTNISFSDDGYSCLWSNNLGYELIDIPTSTYYINGSLRVGYAPYTTAPYDAICQSQAISVPIKVSEFDNIGQVFGLKLNYNSTVLTYTGYTNTSGFAGLTVSNSVTGTTGTITAGPSTTVGAGVSYPDNSVLLTLNFTYNGGSSNLTWNDNGTSCLYRGPNSVSNAILNDSPTATFYINGLIEPLAAPGITKSPNVASVCQTTPVSATFTSGSGGLTPADNYQSSIDGGITWQDYTPGSPLTASGGGSAKIQVRAWRTSTGTTCTATGYQTVSWDVVATSQGGTLGGSTSVCSGTNSTLLTLSGNTGNVVKWQFSTNGTDWTDITNTNTTYTATNLTTATQYRVVVQNGICDIAYSSEATVTVNPLLPVSVTIAADNSEVCAGTTVSFLATPVNGGTAPAYQWTLNGTSISGATDASYAYIPTHLDTIACILTSSETCKSGSPATSNKIGLTVNPLPVVTDATLQYSTLPTGPWTPAAGSFAAGFNVCADSTVEFYYLDINTMAVTQPLLADNLNSFVVDTTNLPANWLSYWAGRGVVNSGGNTEPWQDEMWQIIHGLAPIFYINYTSGDYQLIDGLTYQLSSAQTPLRLSGDYPVWNYNYKGTVKDENNCISSFFDVFLEVNRVPHLLPVSDQTFCHNDITTEVVPGATVPGSTFSWINDKPEIGLAASGTGNIPSFTATNIVTAPVTATITVTPEANGCAGAATALYDITVNPLLQVSVTIAADNSEVCAGTTVSFLATPVNGGTAPAYQWTLNGTSISGATDASYAYIPTHLDTIACILTSSETCKSGSPATSNKIGLTVNPVLPVSVSIDVDTNPVCEGGTVTFTANPVNAGATPGYAWYVNDLLISGATGSQYQYDPSDQDSVFCIVTSSETCTLGIPDSSNEIKVQELPVLPVSLSIWSDFNAMCQGQAINFFSGATNGGTTPSYQWRVNDIDVPGATNATYSYVPVNEDTVSCILISSEICKSGDPAESNKIAMVVLPWLDVDVTIAADANPVFAGTTVEFTATPVNGGNSPQFQWLVNSIEQPGATSSTYSYIPLNNDTVTCRLTSSEICPTGNPALSEPVIMTVNPYIPVSVTIVANQTTVCSGSTVTFTATPVNGGASPAYQWLVNNVTVPGATSSSYEYSPANNDSVKCILTSSLENTSGNPATSNVIKITVLEYLPVSVFVGVSENPVCALTPVTVTAFPFNQGSSPQYQWKKNGIDIPGATNISYTYLASEGDSITCLLTSSEMCTSNNPALSDILVISLIQPTPVSISVSADANPVCINTTVNFSTTVSNEGSAPLYQWRLNNADVVGATSSTWSHIPSNGDLVTCVLTSDVFCASNNPATSNVITMTVNDPVAVGITIAVDSDTVCDGAQANFTATPLNGGSAPQYQWRVNGNDQTGATNSTWSYVPANGDIVTCQITSNATCITGPQALSNAVTMTVRALVPVSIFIGPDANPVCEGTTVNFTSFAFGGGSTPAYQWKVNDEAVPGATNSSFSYAPVNFDNVTCVLTSSDPCATPVSVTSDPVQMLVNPLVAVSVSIAADASSVCEGTSVLFTATPVNGGATPIYQWRVNDLDIPGATSQTWSYIPTDNDVVVCQMVSTLVDCLSDDTVTSNILTMEVIPAVTPTIAISAGQNNVCAGTAVQFTSTIEHGGSSPSYQWIVDNTDVTGATNSVFSIVPVNNQVIKCRLTSNALCATQTSVLSNSVVMTVLPLPTPTVTGQQSVCVSGGNLTYSTQSGQTGYSWTISSGGTILAGQGSASILVTWGTVGSQWLKVTYTGSNLCPGTSDQYNVTVKPRPVPTITGPSLSCVGSTGVVYSTEAGMTGYTWTVSTGGSITSGGGTASIAVTWNTAGARWVKVNYSSNGCTGTTATQKDVTVETPVTPTISISASANPVDAGIPVTFNSTVTNEGTTPLYQWQVNSINVSGATGSSYTYTPADNDQVQCQLTSSLTCVTASSVTSAAIIMDVIGIPASVIVQNETVANGETKCYNALETITVAGGETLFTVQDGGSATLIAGLSITFLPGTSVAPGGYLHAYIAPSGPFCGGYVPPTAPVVISGNEGQPVSSDKMAFSLYPNPTNSKFTLVQRGSQTIDHVRIEVYSSRGERMLEAEMDGMKKQDFNLEDAPSGLYFVRIIASDYTETIKLVKTR